MAGKFQLKSRRWNTGIAIGCAVVAVVAFGGLFLLRGMAPTGNPAFWLLLILGIATFLFFALPGIVYSARKRMGPVKKALPGGTMTWVRAHLYIPVLAMVAAYVHATAAPFRATLTSGKVTLVLAALVLMSGWARHHLIGIQKEALNVNVSINKLTIGQPRAFRTLVTDYTENRRPLAEIEADVATLGAAQQERWAEVKRLGEEVHRYFPREGGQRPGVRHWKVWKALHPPLTILLFVLLGYHVFDVLGGTQAVFGDEKSEFASSDQCADCHSDIYDEWSRSAMAHAQTGTIMEAQLPITINENKELAEELGPEQQELFDAVAKVCINCHAPVGARFAERADALLPFDARFSFGDGSAARAVTGGGDAVQSDGVGCITCHTQESPLEERAGFGELPIDTGGAATYGTQYGPLFSDPDPVPVRVHAMGQGEGDWWADPISSSTLCGACHNVKADTDGDGEDDLVLQTTFDEWTEYVADFEERFEGDDRQTLDAPMSCVDCHMPTTGDGTQGVIDYAPGFMPIPERTHRSHAFVGVDYDLDPDHYQGGAATQREAIEERRKLLGSAVTLEVINLGEVEPGVFGADVQVRNNLLGHAFPTGFAFARQFWLEVSAETADGEPVCLLGIEGLPSPCTSGALEDPTEDLRQCDPLAVGEALGIPFDELLNNEIDFATSFGADDCDPWLTNFQKILTDGDPDGDGVFTEVPYQSFLPQIVKIRARTMTQEEMTPIDSGANDEGARAFRYEFDVAEFPGEDLVVTAQLRFRHLPPDFVRGLADRLEERDDIPDEARIDADELLEHMVIDDLVTARSDEGEQLLCPGPQNGEGISVLDCEDVEGGSDAIEAAPALPASLESPHRAEASTVGAASSLRRFWLPSLLMALIAVVGGSRRLQAFRARRGR